MIVIDIYNIMIISYTILDIDYNYFCKNSSLISSAIVLYILAVMKLTTCIDT